MTTCKYTSKYKYGADLETRVRGQSRLSKIGFLSGVISEI